MKPKKFISDSMLVLFLLALLGLPVLMLGNYRIKNSEVLSGTDVTESTESIETTESTGVRK